MQRNLNSPRKNAVHGFVREQLTSRHAIMMSYLQYLYHENSSLELEIILSSFNGCEKLYQAFIQGTANTKTTNACYERVGQYLENRGFPINFIENSEDLNAR